MVYLTSAKHNFKTGTLDERRDKDKTETARMSNRYEYE